MLELIIALVCLVGMAKRRRKTSFGRYIAGNILVDLALTTIAGKAGAVGATDTVVDTSRISSIRCTYTLSDWTPVANAGPIWCGVMHGDYTQAELEEWVEETGAWDMGNMVAKEVRSRRIRAIGVFDTPPAATGSVRLNDGRPIKTKLNWLLAEGDGLKFWAYNTGNAAAATTVPNFHVFGKANLWNI